MSRPCDYHVTKWGDYYCALKNAEVSYDQYNDYCKRDNKKTCPIYIFWQKNK